MTPGEDRRQREEARQPEAEEWTAFFASKGLDLRARVQTTSWVNGVSQPEIWIEAPGREESWRKLLEVLGFPR